MKSLLELANDKPRLSSVHLASINRDNLELDHKVLKKAGLGGMERMENWGVP